MNKRICRILMFVVLLSMPLYCFSIKPAWIGNTPKASNDTYTFVEIISYGNSVGAARINALHELALNKELANEALISVQSGLLSHSESDFNMHGKDNSTLKEIFDVKVEVLGQEYKVQAQRVDEYIAKSSGGEIKLYSLYMVALTNIPDFSKYYLSESYGIAPAFMSLVPGAGQWYKGSNLKGSLMFAGAVVSVAGIIVCENQRAVYRKKMIEQPKFVKEYNNKATNYQTGRNICIGVAGAVWIYSIVDAAIAKGARKVIVDKRKGSYLSIVPAFTYDSAGVAFAMTF